MQQEEINSLVKTNTSNNPIANSITTTSVTNTSIRIESTTPPLESTAIGLSSLSESEKRTVNLGYLQSNQYARYWNGGFSAPSIQSRAPRLRACLVYVDDNGVIVPSRTARIIQSYPYLGYHQFYSSHQSSHPYQPQYSSYMSAPPSNLVSSNTYMHVIDICMFTVDPWLLISKYTSFQFRTHPKALCGMVLKTKF